MYLILSYNAKCLRQTICMSIQMSPSRQFSYSGRLIDWRLNVNVCKGQQYIYRRDYIIQKMLCLRIDKYRTFLIRPTYNILAPGIYHHRYRCFCFCGKESDLLKFCIVIEFCLNICAVKSRPETLPLRMHDTLIYQSRCGA